MFDGRYGHIQSAEKKRNAYLLASVAMIRIDGGGVVAIISDVTWPEPQPLSWMREPGGKGGSRCVKICLFVSSEVVPIIASKRAAVLGNICLGVKGGLFCGAVMIDRGVIEAR
jgi:hypothetical protein